MNTDKRGSETSFTSHSPHLLGEFSHCDNFLKIRVYLRPSVVPTLFYGLIFSTASFAFFLKALEDDKKRGDKNNRQAGRGEHAAGDRDAE